MSQRENAVNYASLTVECCIKSAVLERGVHIITLEKVNLFRMIILLKKRLFFRDMKSQEYIVFCVV